MSVDRHRPTTLIRLRGAARRSLLLATLAAGAALAATAAPVFAQQITTGTVTGNTADDQGLALPGAIIELINEQTADVRRTDSNGEGLFTIPAVPQGTYTLKVTLDGFKTVERRGILLRAGEVYNAGKVVLGVGELTEVMTVSAELAVVQTGTASRTAVIEAQQMDSLLSRGRDPVSLLNTLPGVTPVTDVTSLGGQIGPATPTIGGQRGASAGLSLDGMAASDGDTGRNTSPMSIDAIEQINVSLNSYTADQGRNSGAQVNIVSKSGSRNFKGTLATYVRNEALNENNYFNKLNNLAKPLYRYNTFTGTLGGPVLLPGGFGKGRDKLFFFYVREMWWAQEPRSPRFITTPTALERTGDFSQSFDQNGRLITIVDPQTGQPFPGNRIPASRINANGQGILNLLPLPNFTDRAVSGGAYNYRDQDIADVRKTLDQLKVDANLTDRDRLSIRWRRWRPITEAYSGTFAVSSNWNEFRHGYAQQEDSWQVNHTHTFGTALVNEVSSSFRYLAEVGPTIDTLDPVTRSKVGLSGLGSLYTANAQNIVPAATFGGVPGTAPTIAFDGRFPIDGEDHRWIVADNLSYATGRHLFKAGIYYEFNRNSEGPGPFVSCFSGCYNFGADANNPLNSGYAFANAVLGNFTSYQEATTRPLSAGHAQFLEWFAQDSWKPVSNLTLELGARFSWGQPWRLLDGQTGGAFVLDRWDPAKQPRLFAPAMVDGRRVGIDRASGQVVSQALIGAIVPGSGDPYNGIVTQDDALGQAGWRDTPPVQVQPRLGFSWDPKGDGKMAVRGGFGISSQVLQDSGDFSNRMPATPPARIQPQIFYGNISSLDASQGYLFPVDAIPAYSRDYKPARTYTFSLEVQRNIGFDTIVSAAYVGNRQRNLIQGRNLNALPGGVRFDPANADPTNPSRPLPDAFLVPYRGYGSIVLVENTGYSNYNSLQVTANRRYKKGLQLGMAYTLSKAKNLTDGDGGFLPVYNDVRAFAYDYAGFDRRHVLTFNYVWDIPNGSGLWNHAISRALLDRWQIAGVTMFATGAPSAVTYTTTDNADILGGLCVAGSTNCGDGGRINVTGDPTVSNPTFQQWFNTSVFSRPAKGDQGNAGRQVIRLPGTQNWDVTLSKMLAGRAGRGLQFRAEFYNLFNINNWTAVDTVARFDTQGNQVNTRFGQVTAAADPRIIQLSLRLMF
jgi:hypothetical protein